MGVAEEGADGRTPRQAPARDGGQVSLGRAQWAPQPVLQPVRERGRSQVGWGRAQSTSARPILLVRRRPFTAAVRGGASKGPTGPSALSLWRGGGKRAGKGEGKGEAAGGRERVAPFSTRRGRAMHYLERSARVVLRAGSPHVSAA